MTTTTQTPRQSLTSADIAELMDTCWWQLSSAEEIWERGDALDQIARLLYALQVACVRELIARGVLEAMGKNALVEKMVQRFRLSHLEARERLETALLTMRGKDSVGETGEPDLPGTAGAIADGAVNAAHVKLITKLWKKAAKAGVQHANWVPLEHVLADQARTDSPDDLRPAIEKTKQVLEQNTPPDEATEKAHTQPDQRLVYRENGADMWKVIITLGPRAKFLLEKIIDVFSKPHPATDEGPDPRTAEQRRGDAFAELLELVMNAGLLPRKGGVRTHMAVSVQLEDLRKELGKILLDGYGVTDPEIARHMACDADILPVVMGGATRDMDIAAERRSAPPWMRYALHERDKGCAFPSCDRRVEFTQPHHIISWAQGGPTVPENLVCLCVRHHQMIHFSEWSCYIEGSRAYFVPPKWLDPQQRPRRNNRFIFEEESVVPVVG